MGEEPIFAPLQKSFGENPGMGDSLCDEDGLLYCTRVSFLPRRSLFRLQANHYTYGTMHCEVDHLPECILQTMAEGLVQLVTTNLHRFPIGIRQHAMIAQMNERLPGNGDAYSIHGGEIRGGQLSLDNASAEKSHPDSGHACRATPGLAARACAPASRGIARDTFRATYRIK